MCVSACAHAYTCWGRKCVKCELCRVDCLQSKFIEKQIPSIKKLHITHIYIYVPICMNMFNMCMCVYIHIRVHIHTYTHIYIYIYIMYKQFLSLGTAID